MANVHVRYADPLRNTTAALWTAVVSETQNNLQIQSKSEKKVKAKHLLILRSLHIGSGAVSRHMRLLQTVIVTRYLALAVSSASYFMEGSTRGGSEAVTLPSQP